MIRRVDVGLRLVCHHSGDMLLRVVQSPGSGREPNCWGGGGAWK